jgi:hypothetical protein
MRILGKSLVLLIAVGLAGVYFSGDFRVLPHRAQTMYAPRIQAISDSARIHVTD